MWLKDLRSAVADGVKEFQHGALSEVQQGIAEVPPPAPLLSATSLPSFPSPQLFAGGGKG